MGLIKGDTRSLDYSPDRERTLNTQGTELNTKNPHSKTKTTEPSTHSGTNKP